MQLVDQGQTSLQDNIEKYLDGYRLTNPFGTPVTIENVLTHTTGFEVREPTDASYLLDSSRRPISLKESVFDVFPPVVRMPGESYMYDNFASRLQGYIVQQVSGEPFQSYMQKHVFGPIGMTSSSFKLNKGLVERLVTSYDMEGSVLLYSLYFSAENESRVMLPYDIIFENKENNSLAFRKQLEKDGIEFVHYPVEAIRVTGVFGSGGQEGRSLLLLPAEQLRSSDAKMDIPRQGEAIWYKGQKKAVSIEQGIAHYPQEVHVGSGGSDSVIHIAEGIDRYAVNFHLSGRQLVMREAELHAIRKRMPASSGQDVVRLDAFQIENASERAAASRLYAKFAKTYSASAPDFYAYYQESLRKFGLIIFIAGFLGLIFLIATGSILYFKQMTEAEQERGVYTILRQLGFSEREIMGGIVRKQLFVFTIPLAIGLVHSSFAVKAASALTLSDIAFPAAMAMAIYTVIYFAFAILTIGYYRRVVRLAL
ncbi:hypothetical protein FHS16_001492 [Paenibacillus endophyticus]|uniref:Beta-lactamase-related domain-containing protein n=2 Tax=Paenibacillus endophyticus TaxID=1294268 RepID=A0A7W5G8U5_9BACL|nr:hypothetical protein [Paenibacillus endophyticus]